MEGFQQGILINLIYFFKECLWLLWRKWTERIEGSSRETSGKALAASQVIDGRAERKEVAGLGVNVGSTRGTDGLDGGAKWWKKGVKEGSRFLALVSWPVGDGSAFDLDAPKTKR